MLEILLLSIVTITYIIILIFFIISILNNIKNGVPQVATFNSDFKVLKKGLKKYNLEGKTLVDMGSGTGKTIRFFEKEFKSNVIGYEIDLSNYIISFFLSKVFKKKAKIYLKNYLKADISNIDLIYVYLFPILIIKIEEKIWNEAKTGTIIISNAFKFKNKKAIEILKNKEGKEEIYIYKV